MIDIENTTESREELARLIVANWDLSDLVHFAEERLMNTWDPAMNPDDADLYWLEDVELNRDELEECLNIKGGTDGQV